MKKKREKLLEWGMRWLEVLKKGACDGQKYLKIRACDGLGQV